MRHPALATRTAGPAASGDPAAAGGRDGAARSAESTTTAVATIPGCTVGKVLPADTAGAARASVAAVTAWSTGPHDRASRAAGATETPVTAAAPVVVVADAAGPARAAGPAVCAVIRLAAEGTAGVTSTAITTVSAGTPDTYFAAEGRTAATAVATGTAGTAVEVSQG